MRPAIHEWRPKNGFCEIGDPNRVNSRDYHRILISESGKSLLFDSELASVTRSALDMIVVFYYEADEYKNNR